MEQKDYLMRQIDQLGQVLATILGKFLRLKTEGQVLEGIEYARQSIKEEFDIDLDYILSLGFDKSIELLMNKHKMTINHVETFTDILLETAENNDIIKQNQIYSKCLELFEFVNKNDKNISFERFQKIENLRNIIKIV